MTAINSNRAIRGPVTAVPVVAGKGVRLVADTENNRWVVEADETVLYSAPNDGQVTTCTLSESVANFERIRIISGINSRSSNEINVPSSSFVADLVIGVGNNAPSFAFVQFDVNGTTLTANRSIGIVFSSFGTTPTYRANNTGELQCINKVVGINRVASA